MAAIKTLDVEAIGALRPLEEKVTKQTAELKQDLASWQVNDPLSRLE